VWWIASVPHQPLRLYQAIPHTAIFVSEHDWLGRALERFRNQSPGGGGCGRDRRNGGGVGRFNSDPVIARWRQRLAAREAVIAYVPALGFQGEPAWIVAAWIGGDSQRLRWNTLFARGSGLREVRLGHSSTIWIVETEKSAAQERHLSLALSEGVLLGCLSRDPQGVRSA